MLRNLHLNTKILLLTSSLLSLSFGLTYPYLPEYIYGLTGEASSVGLIISLRSSICILALIIGGYLGDTLGRTIPIGAGTIFLGAAQITYALAHNTPELLFAALLDGFSAFYFPSFTAMIMDTTAREQLTQVFTISFIVEHLPYAFMPILGGFLRDQYGIVGLRLGFRLSGATAIIIGLVRVKLLSETLSGARRVGIEALWAAYRSIPRDFFKIKPTVRRLVLLRGLCTTTATSMFQYFAVLYATRYTQVVSYTEWGLITALASLPLISTVYLSRLIAGVKTAPAYATLIFVEGLAVVVFMVPKRLAFALSMVLLNACGALIYAIERSTVAAKTEENMRSRAETFMALSFYLGSSLGSYIGGLTYTWHPPSIFPITSTLLIVGSILGFIVLKK